MMIMLLTVVVVVLLRRHCDKLLLEEKEEKTMKQNVPKKRYHVVESEEFEYVAHHFSEWEVVDVIPAVADRDGEVCKTGKVILSKQF